MLFLIIRDCSPGLCNSEMGLKCQCMPLLLWDLHRCVWRAHHGAGENVLSQTLVNLPNCSRGSLGICTPVVLELPERGSNMAGAGCVCPLRWELCSNSYPQGWLHGPADPPAPQGLGITGRGPCSQAVITESQDVRD